MSDTEYFESTRPSSVATTPPPETDGELTIEEKELLQVDQVRSSFNYLGQACHHSKIIQVDHDHLPEKVKYIEDMVRAFLH